MCYVFIFEPHLQLLYPPTQPYPKIPDLHLITNASDSIVTVLKGSILFLKGWISNMIVDKTHANRQPSEIKMKLNTLFVLIKLLVARFSFDGPEF